MDSCNLYPAEKSKLYPLLHAQLDSMSQGEGALTVLCNSAALLYQALPQINWAGFYLVSGQQLVLGPFVGKPACTRIPRGKGVCGTAWQSGSTQLVADVHAFPGHIACDSQSQSEIVIPLGPPEQPWGVLDIDSPLPARFDEADRQGLEEFARRLESLCPGQRLCQLLGELV